MDFTIALLSFIVTIGVVVTVHELGHYYVAKKFKIKVLRFSIGFGKIIKTWKQGETDFTLCAIPLGGFVKMLDENETDVDKSEKHRAFNNQNVYKRLAVVIAGPIANFILAIIIFTIIYISGVNGIKPIVGMVNPGGIADISGLNNGDQLLSINGNKVQTISEFSIQIFRSQKTDKIPLEVLSLDNNFYNLELQLPDDFLSNTSNDIEKNLGFNFSMPTLEAVIDEVIDDSPASLAGLEAFDKIININGEVVTSWSDFVDKIKNNSNKPILLQIERGESLFNFTLMPNIKNGTAKIGVKVYVPNNYLDEWVVIVKKNPIDAFISANVMTYQLVLLNLKMIAKMMSGDAPLNQLSGPVGIADYAGKTAQAGVIAFLSFLALISIGIGLLNLLPIPSLDGGHVLIYLIEIAKGSPVNKSIQQILFRTGLLVILSLISVALYNDISKLLF